MMKRSDFIKLAGTASMSGFFLNKTFSDHPIIKPKRLSEGDTIGLIAPAGIIYQRSEFRRMEKVLNEFGLNVQFGKHVRRRFGYLSGTDEQRVEDLHNAFENPDVDAVMAVRGGWGCARLLPYINFDLIKQNPKLFCGFSDNTTLHLAFLHYSGLISFHGPNGNSDWSDLTKESFHKTVFEGEKTEFKSRGQITTIHSGKATGRLIGGNLSIFTTSLGTPYQPDTKGAILFLEDIAEAPYKIDRMLSHLTQAGILKDIRGFVFGKCTRCDEGGEYNFTLNDLFSKYIRPLGIPAIFNADIGHEEDNFTLPQGVEVELDADKGVLRLTESAVN